MSFPFFLAVKRVYQIPGNCVVSVSNFLMYGPGMSW
jgi:hypothetical protein